MIVRIAALPGDVVRRPHHDIHAHIRRERACLSSCVVSDRAQPDIRVSCGHALGRAEFEPGAAQGAGIRLRRMGQTS